MLQDLILSKSGQAPDPVVANLLMVCGLTGKAGSSPDYANYTNRSASFPNVPLYCAARVDDHFYIGGGSRTLKKSSDLVNWSDVTLSTFPTNHLYNTIIYVNDILLILGASGKIARSINKGVSWTYPTSVAGTFDSFCSITYGNGLFVAITTSNLIVTSPDGITWTQRTFSGGSGTFRRVTYGLGKYVIVGDSGRLLQSSNGISWTNSQGSGAFGSANIKALAYGNSRLLAISDTGGVFTSFNAINWSLTTFAALSGCNDMVHVDGADFAACGHSKVFITENNGAAWTTVMLPSPLNVNMNAIASSY